MIETSRKHAVLSNGSRQHTVDSGREKENARSTTACMRHTDEDRSSATVCPVMSTVAGVTLVELLVVISIVAILAVALGFNYSGWSARYKVESQVKQLYSDLVGARLRAMERGMTVFTDFTDSTHYRVIEDTNGNAVVDAAPTDTLLTGYPKAVDYPVSASSVDNSTSPATVTSQAIGSVVISFDRRGLLSCPTLFTLGTQTRGVISFASTASPDYDCITISQTIISMGQMSGGVCNAK
jgi:prepilin-type N-terminal cleavage/methylation domain-containing protein